LRSVSEDMNSVFLKPTPPATGSVSPACHGLAINPLQPGLAAEGRVNLYAMVAVPPQSPVRATGASSLRRSWCRKSVSSLSRTLRERRRWVEGDADRIVPPGRRRIQRYAATSAQNRTWLTGENLGNCPAYGSGQAPPCTWSTSAAIWPSPTMMFLIASPVAIMTATCAVSCLTWATRGASGPVIARVLA
jgi:hypothetical protein